jgi:3-deoxy-D-manno-octulosonate 8-phosphate phosphatase (KDO 8-P phosphatase)
MKFLKDINNNKQVVDLYKDLGATFITPYTELIERLPNIKAFVFDWDGVFNAGFKGVSTPSTFSEPDISGINLMRYAYYLHYGEIPAVIIITGEANENSVKLANRENFNFVYQKVVNKVDACIDVMSKLNLVAGEVACVYDDFNDSSMAKICALRYLINRSASPIFTSYLINNNFCDYITAHSQPNNPIREICELNMALLGKYDEAVNSRTNFDEVYKKYMGKRAVIKPEFYALHKGTFSEVITAS